MQETNSTGNRFQITPLSDRSVLVSFGNIIDASINEKVFSLHQLLLQNPFDGFIESVPAYASLAVFFDTLKIKKLTGITAFVFVKKFLIQLLYQAHSLKVTEYPVKKIPVCYDPEFAVDIIDVAQLHGLSIPEVISLHTSVIYRVYMIGFTPGFAYMGTLVQELITPRKEQPRLIVPAGSVGIAGAQTGIYPIESPGGWQIIGKTPLQLFNAKNTSPCLLAAGDRIQFFPIDKNNFANHGD
ncbi:MAG: 5-oxoprolinase subunit PxpB [Ferruginibacter sp.]